MRKPKLEITLDDDGVPYIATIYLPVDPKDQPKPKDIQNVPIGQRMKKPTTVIPEVTTLPYGDHTEIIFSIQGDFITERKPYPLTYEEQTDIDYYEDFWGQAEELLPTDLRSKSWLPIYLRDQHSEDFDIVAAKDYYCPGMPDWVSPLDLPKLYSYREGEIHDVGVVQNTVHLPKSWIDTHQTLYDSENKQERN